MPNVSNLSTSSYCRRAAFQWWQKFSITQISLLASASISPDWPDKPDNPEKNNDEELETRGRQRYWRDTAIQCETRNSFEMSSGSNLRERGYFASFGSAGEGERSSRAHPVRQSR